MRGREGVPNVWRIIMTAIYRGETVRIVAWNASGTKAKIATSSGLRWAQKSELSEAPHANT